VRLPRSVPPAGPLAMVRGTLPVKLASTFVPFGAGTATVNGVPAATLAGGGVDTTSCVAPTAPTAIGSVDVAVRLPLVAAIVYPLPAWLSVTPVNVATPATAAWFTV